MTSRSRRRPGKLLEFSKLILLGVMGAYFFGVWFGAKIVEQQHDLLPYYLTFLGSPVTVAIGFYAWKARGENLIKLGANAKEVISWAVGNAPAEGGNDPWR